MVNEPLKYVPEGGSRTPIATPPAAMRKPPSELYQVGGAFIMTAAPAVAIVPAAPSDAIATPAVIGVVVTAAAGDTMAEAQSRAVAREDIWRIWLLLT
jgi:hypothetical protein